MNTATFPTMGSRKPGRSWLPHLLPPKPSANDPLAGILPVADAALTELANRCTQQAADRQSEGPAAARDRPQLAANGTWIDSARRHLTNAQDAWLRGKPELGWRSLNAAWRAQLAGWHQLDRRAFEGMARAILHEAQEKLPETAWRRKTITSLLSQKDGQLQANLTPDCVMYAAQLLHEHDDNVHRFLHLLDGRMKLLALAGTAVAAAWILSAPDGAGLPIEAASHAARMSFYASVAGLGVMGAVVSSFINAQDSGKGKIPERLQTPLTAYARLAMGAVLALVAAIVLTSGLFNVNGATLQVAVYATAIAAGFSEQLVGRALTTIIQKVAGGSEAAPPPASQQP